MPVQITQNNFVDAFGVSTPQYRSNAGDEITAQFEVRTQIRITSINNPLTLDPSLNTVTSASQSWLDEGFRVGDWCRITLYASGGTPLQSWYSQILYVDDITCDFGAMPYWYNISNNEFIVIYALDYFGSPTPPPAAGFYDPRPRNDLDVLINHSLNNQAGNTLSLIDGEASRAVFNGVGTMSVGANINGVFVSNQSGQFFKTAQITRNADNADNWNTYTIALTFANSGMYDQSWFSTNLCLKFFMRLLWASIPNDQYARVEATYDEDANTGWFNEAHNVSIADSTLVQGITELDYCVPSTHTVIVDGVLTDIGIGACYVSTNDAYYRNRIQNQYPITMLVPTTNIGAGLMTSPFNEFGAGYEIEIINTNVIGSQTEIEFTFTPNNDFNTFMTGVDDGDRLFYIWIKCGNINHLVFSDQLKCDPPVGGIINMFDDYGFLDHSQNVTEITGIQTDFEADTEDDISYFGSFTLEEGVIYDSFGIKIEAYNTVTEEDFTLQETTFVFGSVQIDNNGRYLLNESNGVVSTLPTTSSKLNAIFKLYPSIDSGANYGVSIYYPFLLNWKYWLQQQNASTDFYPTQNKDWEQYDNIGDWVLRTELTLIQNGLAYTHSNVFIDNEYDHEEQIESEIELIRDINGQIVNVVPDGELMRIKATHEYTAGNWDQTTTWGMITIEPFETERRWICSSVVNFDNDINNPLYPLAGLLITIQFPAPNIAVLECYFDSNKIDLTNGVKITSKIKQGKNLVPPFNEKTMAPDDAPKTTDTGDQKELAP